MMRKTSSPIMRASFGGLALAVVEISRHGDDGFRDAFRGRLRRGAWSSLSIIAEICGGGEKDFAQLDSDDSAFLSVGESKPVRLHVSQTFSP